MRRIAFFILITFSMLSCFSLDIKGMKSRLKSETTIEEQAAKDKNSVSEKDKKRQKEIEEINKKTLENQEKYFAEIDKEIEARKAKEAELKTEPYYSEKEYTFSVKNPNIKIAKLWACECYVEPEKVIKLYDEDLKTILIKAVELNNNIFWHYYLKIKIVDNKLIIKFYNFTYEKADVMGVVTDVSDTTDKREYFYKACDDLANEIYKYYLEF